MRITKKAKDFTFARENVEDPWTLQQEEDDTLFVGPVERFVLFSVPEQLTVEQIMKDALPFTFADPRGRTFILGYDTETRIAFLDVNPSKFTNYDTEFFVGEKSTDK